MADNPPDKIDPGKPPGGKPWDVLWTGNISYKGAVYSPITGQRLDGENPEPMDPNAFTDSLIDEFNPLAPFGISQEDFRTIATRAGIIVLGAALSIVGLAFVISGTKTAALVKSAIPVAGKVL